MKPLYLFANWKMYLSVAESSTLAAHVAALTKDLPAEVATAVFPSSLAFSAVEKVLAKSSVALGAQNVHWIEKGGYTGEVSAAMFKQAGATYALVGHSERRHLFHESNHEVRQKMEASLAAGLIPVVCVGETLREKEALQANEVLEAQLRAAYTDIVWPSDTPLLIAYEPVWAISKGADKVGLPCDPEEAESIHKQIITIVKALLPAASPVLLFGGSVRPATVQGYLAEPNIHGVLIGAASTRRDNWKALVKSALNS